MDNKLKDFINRDNCYFIHYASDGFYNGSNPAPRVSCIVIYNLKNDIGYRFSMKDHMDENSLEQAERLTLENFKLLFTKTPDVSFIHWNMNADGFGFKAIRARAKDLGIELPEVSAENLFDLSSYVAYIAEKKLSVKQILWFNSLLYGDNYLDGKTEAEYFYECRFEEIYNSVNLKVHGFADVVELIWGNKLKTEAPYRVDDGLTKEERHREAVKRAQMREQIINDIMEHNRRILQKKEETFDNYIETAKTQIKERVDEYLQNNGAEIVKECHNGELPHVSNFADGLISMFESWFK